MKYIILSGLFLLILFSISKFIFDPSHLYYEIWWLDIPMHFLGGFGVATLAISYFHYKKKSYSFIQIFMCYLCVAIVWELYEIIHDMIRVTMWGGWEDTISDVINGGIGGTLAYLLFKK